MLYIPVLSTRRLRVKLKEIGLGDGISVAMMPAGQSQAGDTAFLRAIIADGGEHPDPELWTIPERALAVGHYLMAIFKDDPDFPVGERGRFSDYLDADTDVPDEGLLQPMPLGTLERDVWGVQHLLGYMAEAIERLQGQVAVPGGDPYLHWRFGCMAAQLVRESEEPPAPDWTQPGRYDDWLADRMRTLLALPESSMAQLMGLFDDAQPELYHLFGVGFDRKGGLVFLPKQKPASASTAPGKEAEADLPPATFPSHTCLSSLSKELAGNTTANAA